MSEMKRNSTVLESCLAKPVLLAQLIDYADDSVVSKTIIDKPVGTLTLFAFDEGQGLSEHTAPYDAVVQILDGRAVLTIGGKKINVTAGIRLESYHYKREVRMYKNASGQYRDTNIVAKNEEPFFLLSGRQAL